jgi:CRISPR-associated protein Csm1
MGIELWFCDSERVRAHARPGAIIARLNRADLSPPSVGTSVHDFRWVPAFTPLDAHRRIVELEAMADGSGGAPYWACLRLDVDNLGEVFRFGLGERRYSLSRIATLTFMLSLFFEGYVNRICAEVDPEGQHLYLIYSGGDDLLLIGAWDRVVEAARRTREELVRFTGENPSLTVSAGLSLHHAKFPLYQAAREAGDQLDVAKHFRHADGHEKDACGFFGTLMSWDDLGWVRRWADGLVTLIEKGTGDGDSGEKLSRGFLFKLARIGAAGAMEDRHRRATRQGLAEVSRSVGLHRARWRLVYDVAREHLALRDKLEALREELIERDVRPELVASLVRWVELKTRAREPKERGR